jgi:hypothetical protein
MLLLEPVKKRRAFSQAITEADLVKNNHSWEIYRNIYSHRSDEIVENN